MATQRRIGGNYSIRYQQASAPTNPSNSYILLFSANTFNAGDTPWSNDADGDGVIDYSDRCPDTLSGAPITEYGCDTRKTDLGVPLQTPTFDPRLIDTNEDVQGYEWRAWVSTDSGGSNQVHGRVWFDGASSLHTWQDTADSSDLSGNSADFTFRYVRGDGYRYDMKYRLSGRVVGFYRGSMDLRHLMGLPRTQAFHKPTQQH